MERIDTLKAFVAKERSTMKSFNDPKNIEKHKWYIKESLTNMKGEMLREIDGLLQDKRVTLMRQYNNHNDSLRREITELENERKEIYNFKFNDGAIMKNAKVRSFLAQEFRDLKARLSKKSFKDNKPKSQREVWLTGLSSIKDSLKRFKDESKFYRNNGYRIQITALNNYIEYIVFDPKGAYRALKKESGFNSEKEALKAAEAYTNSLPHSDRWKDANWAEGKHKRDKDGKFSSTGNGGKSANESNAGSKRSDVKSLAKSKNKKEVKKVAKAYWTHFLNGVDDLVDWAGEDEDLRYYAEDGDIEGMAEIMANSKGGRETAIEALDEMEEDELNDVSEHINDSAIKDVDISSLCNKYHVDESDMKKIISAIKRNAKGKRVSYRNMPEIGGYLYETFSNVARDLGYEMTMWDSAEHINDEIVRTVQYNHCHIWISKTGNEYRYSVYYGSGKSSPLASDAGFSNEEEAMKNAKVDADRIANKYNDSAEYINDRKIDIKKDGKLIDVVNAGSLDEAVRIYERQHPELRGQIDAYFSDGKVEDGFEEEWSKLMFKMKRLQMNPNTKWSEMEALNEEMNALKKKYGKNN